jgi:LysR family transcriptional regulator, transcriptional activator of nhaA
VARAGSLKLAARTFHLSSPTLSAQLRALEESLGTPLFRREGRKLLLNDTGRVVRRYAERIFELGDEMAEVVDRGEPAGPGTVHLGIVDGVPKPLATDIVRRAWEKVPSLRLVAREGLPGELFPALAAHQIDIVVSNEAPSAQLGAILSSRRVARFKVLFAAAPGLSTKQNRPRQIDKFPLLLPTRESPLRRELDRWFADRGLRPDVRAEFDDTAAMYELAASGLGAVPVPAPMLGHVQERYGLRDLRVNTGIEEELFVVTAERQFTHEGPRLLAAVARELFAVGGKARAGRA